MRVDISTKRNDHTFKDVTSAYNDNGLYLINFIEDGKRKQFAVPLYEIFDLMVVDE